MRFSVVIPLYNKQAHVLDTLASVVAQTHPAAEIIVVDDGSTDGGDTMVEDLRHPGITLLRRSPPGPGGYAARNMGIEVATSEWIAFCDADDIWMPDHLANLTRAAAAAGDGVGCVFARADIVSADGRRPYRMAEDLLPTGAALSMGDIVKAWLATERCPLWTSAVAMKRDVLIGAGLFPAGRARRGGDKDMWLRAVAACTSAYSPAISAEFHQDTENRVTRSTAHVDPPVLIETIAALMKTASSEDRALLRALANQELALYARHAAGRRSAVGARFLRAIYLPEGMPAMARILSYMLSVPMMRAIDAIRR